jgi:hypothetical protein
MGVRWIAEICFAIFPAVDRTKGAPTIFEIAEAEDRAVVAFRQ